MSQTAVIVTPDNQYCSIIASLFEEIDHLTKEKPFGYEEEVQCDVFKLLLSFHRSLGNALNEPIMLSPKHQKIYEIAEFISANMSEIDSLDSLCARFFISKYYLCHSFKEVTGMSVMAFLNMTRVLRAIVLLREGNMTIVQIARAVGFATVAHFTDVFKRIEGVTPYEYRRKAKQHIDK
jgi:AraC-like DNA-binding protein